MARSASTRERSSATSFGVEYDWRPVGAVTREEHVDATWRLRFPANLHSEPAVYRLLFDLHDGTSEVYVGESDYPGRRARQYRRVDGTQKTSRWLHEHLQRRLLEGAGVRMELMVDARYSVGEGPWHQTDLRRKEHRLILENAALAIALAALADPGPFTPAIVLNKIAEGAA